MNLYIYFQDAILELCREKPNRISVSTHSNISLRLHYVKVIPTVTFRRFVVKLHHWTIPSVYHLTLRTSLFLDIVGGLPKWTRLFPSPSPALFLYPLCWPLLHQYPRQITPLYLMYSTSDVIWMSKRYSIINGEKKYFTLRLTHAETVIVRREGYKALMYECFWRLRNCKNAILQINRIRMWLL